MNDADIKIMQVAIADAIKVTVNGKIDKIQEDVNSLHEKMNELKPVLEAQRVVFSVSKFIKWGGPTIATLYALFKWLK